MHDLHLRYQIQANWTMAIRNRLCARFSLADMNRVLEVGSGTGVIAGELAGIMHGSMYGLDIDAPVTAYAKKNSPGPQYIVANALGLPFPTNSFNAALCHFLLLWVSSPQEVLAEMTRVTKSGGAVLALAEPDYGGRIDYPSSLIELGRQQTIALAAQGADPLIGRKLHALFSAAGLVKIQVGLLGGEWSGMPSSEEIDSEWTMLQSDLAHRISDKDLDSLKQIDQDAWRKGSRILFVPTFYAHGHVP